MSGFEVTFARQVVARRWWIIVVSLVLLAAASTGITRLQLNSSYRVFFGPDNPQLLAFEALENTYVKNDSLMIVFAPARGTVFDAENLAIIREMTAAAWQIPYSNRVDSLTNYQHTTAAGDDLVVGDLVPATDALSETELDAIRRAALASPSLRGALVREDGKAAGLFVNMQPPGADQNAENAAIVAAARDIATSIEQRYPGARVYLSGMVMMNNAFPEATGADLRTLIPLAGAVMMALLAVFVGGIGGTLAAVFIFLASIAAALGLSGYLAYPVTPVSSSGPIIILTVAVANCVHVLANFRLSLAQGNTREAAVRESLRVNLQPIVLASLTTAIGFATLNFSEVPPFRHLGNTVAMGVVISLALSLTLLPALLTVLPVAPVKPRQDTNFMARLASVVVAQRRLLMWSAGILIAVLVANIPRNELNDVFVHWFDESMEFRRDTDFLTENLGGLYTIEFSLDSRESGGISEPAFLADTDAFVAWLRAYDGVRHVRSYTDTVKRLNQNMHGDDPAMYRLPESRALAAQYLLTYEMSLPYGLDLNNRINVARSSLRVTATTDTLSTKQILALADAAEAWLDANAPSIEASPASSAIVMFANIAERNIRAMLLGTTLALVAISLMLVVAFRSVRIGLLSLIPNLAPAAMGFGVWGLAVGQVGLSLSIVISMSLGIVVDDTVHFLSKYLRARRERALEPPEAVRYAFMTVGKPLVVTSIILIAGFGILACSHFANNADVGLVTAMIIAFALFADFLFLPPLLMWVERRSGH